MKTTKYLLGLSARVLLLSVITVVVLELMLTVFNDFVFRHSFFVYDPDIGFKVRPYAQWGEYQANEFGFNDRDYPHDREDDTYRVLIVGDSFNWIGGPHDNYVGILEGMLQRDFGDRRVEVINVGYSETHTGEQLKILRKFGLQYNPDLVVLGFFVGNDFLDADPWRKRIVIGTVVTEIDTRTDPEVTLFGQPLVWQSRFYLFVNEQRVVLQQLQSQAAAAATSAETSHISMSTPAYQVMEFRRMQVSNLNQSNDFALRTDNIQAQLLATRDLLADRGIDFMVVAYPDEFQVDEGLRQAVIDRYQVDVSSYDWNRPQNLLNRFSMANNIEYYDMLPAFLAAHDEGHHLYLPNDSHWNKAGSDLAASFLYQILAAHVHESLN